MDIIATDKAPAAIGPYSQAVKADGFIFCSGQLGIDPVTGMLVGDDIESQTRQVLNNIRALLGACGLDLTTVVKTTIFLADLDNFPVVNAIYGKEFGDHTPARATVEVSRLPLDALIEIECIAQMRKVTRA
ncbi:MAG: RidA family protein [Deltaproteobacteria bacterium]|nr:RidA family protein [Deltaproteobacteria bacterium]